MKFIAVICAILLATSTGFATPLAAPAADISAESPALEGRQDSQLLVSLCSAINSTQSLANEAISTVDPSLVIMASFGEIQELIFLSRLLPRTTVNRLINRFNTVKAEVNNGTTSATAAIAKLFLQTKAILVSTSFLDYIGE